MNAVLGYTDLLSSILTDKTQKNYIDSIKSSGRSLLTLINDILDLSKIEAGKLVLVYDYVNSDSFFTEFERIFALKASEKGIRFIVEIASGMPAGIYVDEPRIRQIIFNLVGNAIKFTNHGYVKLNVLAENYRTAKIKNENSREFLDLIIEVQDTGIGISKELRNEIFEPFVQASAFKNYGGTGLGLAITRRLTSLMNGTISVSSLPGQGSTFSVRIPDVAFKRDFYFSDADPQIDPSEIKFANATLLIVDDVEQNRSYVRDALKNSGISVIEAADGEIGYNIAKYLVPNIIIADIRMPRVDGLQLLNKIKSNKKLKDIPVIAYSASALKDQKAKILQNSFAGLLTKPVIVGELYSEIMKFLNYTVVKKPKSEQTESDSRDLREITDFKALLHSLESDLKDTWKTFEIRQPIGDIRSFGEKLINLGNKHNSILITEYGTDLKNAANSFSIDSILRLIRQYPEIVENLKNLNIIVNDI